MIKFPKFNKWENLENFIIWKNDQRVGVEISNEQI